MLPTFRAFQQLRKAVVISHNLAKSRLLVQIGKFDRYYITKKFQ